MRLDKYLKVSRLIKRRTVANEACDNERVTVNGRVARASYDVKVGDVITIRFGQKALSVEVLSVVAGDNVIIFRTLSYNAVTLCREGVFFGI